MLSIGSSEFHSPQQEAALFYGLFLRGHSIEALREQIDVSPKVFRKWMRARDFDPDFREALQRMYTYRKQVLAIFDALVTSEQASQRWQ
jgi:transposase-like protein